MAEFDYTAPVEAAAKAWWDEHGNVIGPDGSTPVDWDLVPGLVKAQVRMVLFEAVVAAVDTAFEQKEFERMMGG